MKMFYLVCFASLLLAEIRVASAQTSSSSYQPPADISFRQATIISEGSRLAAEVFAAKSNDDQPLPTIILCHGWGGIAERLRPEAVAFARAGYLAVTFDYRGWGPSEGRLVATRPLARGKPGGPNAATPQEITAQEITVQEIREVVDPLDQTTDLANAIHWVHGEKQCDKDRIGLWGSSYSGGHVVYAAARDQRVKATVSQVPGMDSRFVMQGAARKQTLDDATRRTHGEIGYPAPGAVEVGKLRGAPIRERLMNYAPVEEAGKAPGCAMLFIIAEKEELFDNRDHGIKAHALVKGPKKLVTIPNITHYGVYNEARSQVQSLAIEWFDMHLKRRQQPPETGK
jgi:dienelactone hydrolase